MRAKKPFIFLAVAVCAALAICQFWKPVAYGEQLIRVQAAQELGHIDRAILDEPLEVQALLLDYAPDRRLVLKAWLALSAYPDAARKILPLYGAEPEFRRILLAYGEPVIPVIRYFRDNDVWVVKAGDAVTTTMGRVGDFLGDTWRRMQGGAADEPKADARPGPYAIGPDQRGWYAVNIIAREGHDLLGQFVVAGDAQVKRNQTDRVFKAITSFFTGGVRRLETRYDLGQEITRGDVFWAGLDVATIAAPLLLFRAGKLVAASGKELSLATRTRLLAPRLLAEAKYFQALGKYGLVAATVYIVATHPSLINSVLGEAATLMGLNPLLVQFTGWTLLIFLILYPFSWLLKGAARFTLLVLSLLTPRRMRGA